MGPEYPTFRVVVTGSRDWTDTMTIWQALNAVIGDEQDFLLAVGDCPTGADRLAKAWGRKFLRWPVTEFTAPWDVRGKPAGMIRNHFMIDMFRPRLVLAFPLPQSRGTVDCANYAESKGIEVRRF